MTPPPTRRPPRSGTRRPWNPVNLDRNLMVAYGGLVLVLMLGVLAAGGIYFQRVVEVEEDRLTSMLTKVLAHSINRTAFSGKYQARLLIEEIVADQPLIRYAMVVDREGRILAHSDPELNDRLAEDEAMAAAQGIFDGAGKVIQELDYQGEGVKEIATPYRSGYGDELTGVIRVGISTQAKLDAMRRGWMYMVGLIVMLFLIGMLVIHRISGYFGRPVRQMALELEGILRHTPLLIYIRDREGVIQEASASFADGLGIELGDPVGMPLEQVAPKAWLELAEPDSDAIFRAKRVTHSEVELPVDGKTRAYVVSRFPIAEDEEGRPALICSMALDVTKRKQAEEALRRTQKMEAIGQMTGGIAHDFNNLLGVVIGNLELAQQRSDDPEGVLERIQPALKAAQRGGEVTQQLLAFSRKEPMARRSTDVNRVLTDLDKILARAVTTAIDVRFALSDGIWFTEVNSGDLEDAIINLVINARDAMPDGGRIDIETTNTVLGAKDGPRAPDVPPGEYVRVTVRDDGCGMAPETLERIFEPFFTTKSSGKGTGLGLSMVYGFVQRSGGHIEVESALGEGTRVELFLPRTLSAPVEDSPAERVIPDLPRGDETILVVDDEEALCLLADEYLSELGYRVLTAGNAHEALEVLQREPRIALLFTDVLMPGGMTGFELATQAKALRPDLRLLLTSGAVKDTVAPEGPGRSAELLPKPYRHEELARRVRRALD